MFGMNNPIWNRWVRMDRHVTDDTAFFWIEPTWNLPSPVRLFISSDKIDMIPYQCSSAIADNYFEAIGIIARAARRAGLKSYHIIVINRSPRMPEIDRRENRRIVFEL